MRIAVINPNTTESMTEVIAAAARHCASPGTEIVAITSRTTSRARCPSATRGRWRISGRETPTTAVGERSMRSL